MLARFVTASLALASLPGAQLVSKVNGPLVGSVSSFTWTPDGRYVLYGAERNSLGIEVVTSVRVSDGSEAVYDPYPFYGSAAARGFVFLPDPELVGVSYSFWDGYFPGATGSPLHILQRSTAVPVTVIAPYSEVTNPRFLDDGRMVCRAVDSSFHAPTYESAVSARWDAASAGIGLSPPTPGDDHVGLVLPAPRSGVAVFGWDESVYYATNSELLAVPIDGGTPVPLSPPPSGRLRQYVEALHVRASDELVIYQADETQNVAELWAVPVDGSLAPRRLNPPLVLGRSVSSPTVAPDEAHLVFVSDANTDEVYELWSTDIDSGTSVRLSGPMVTGGDAGDAYHGEFWISPDSTRVVYRADQRVDDVFELFSAPIEGGAPAVRLHPALPASDDAMTTVDFTPDGRLVVFAVRTASGEVLLAAPADGSGTPVALNQPFVQGGGVLNRLPADGVVAIAPGGRHVFFLGYQDAYVVQLYSVPIDGSAPPLKWNAPLVTGGNVMDFAVCPSPGAVLYRADQDVDDHFELYLSKLPDVPPPHASSSAPTRTVTVTVGG